MPCYACVALIDTDCRKGPHCELAAIKADPTLFVIARLIGWDSSTYKCRKCGTVLIRPNYKHSENDTWRHYHC
ncbi:hypothetical protein GO294_00265 [Ralstonia solanacearum]|nr:hypothetical protein [Ralstonia solanacearum]